MRNRKRFYYSNDKNKAERDVFKKGLGSSDPRVAVKDTLHPDHKLMLFPCQSAKIVKAHPIDEYSKITNSAPLMFKSQEIKSNMCLCFVEPWTNDWDIFGNRQCILDEAQTFVTLVSWNFGINFNSLWLTSLQTPNCCILSPTWS